MNRRAFARIVSMTTAGFALAGTGMVIAACGDDHSTGEVNSPDAGLDQDDPMPVSFSDVLLLPAGEPDFVSSYGEAPQQFGELWQPGTEGPLPLVVLIHGGCWQGAYDIEHIRPAATALRKAGYLVWAIEYRRIGEQGGGWPGTFDDVGLAIDHLDEVLKRRGLTTRSRVFMGHSAGGQLALWAAARPGLADNHRFHSPNAVAPDAVVGLAAITDMKTYAEGESSCEKSAVQLLGTPAEQPDRYAAVSPLHLLPLRVPAILAQGVDDPIVPPAQSETFHARALAAGDDSSLLWLAGAGHFDLIHPRTAAWRAILSALGDCS